MMSTNLSKLQWRSRRSSLELDILFGKFFSRAADLSIQELELYHTLVSFDDSDIWQLLILGCDDVLYGRSDIIGLRKLICKLKESLE